MTHTIDDVGMHVFTDDKGHCVLKYSPNADTVWAGKAMGFCKVQIDDLHEAIAEVMQLRIIAGLVDNIEFAKVVSDEPGKGTKRTGYDSQTNLFDAEDTPVNGSGSLDSA